MYISESFLTGFIVIVVSIALLTWAIKKSNKSDMKHNKSKLESPKYNNEVYISFRNMVHKAYESFEESGYNIAWESDRDRFIIREDGDDPSDSGPILYVVGVHHDDQKPVESNDSFYIVVSHGIFFDRLYYDKYKEKAEYLNNYLHKELNKPGIYFTIETAEYSKVGIYHCNTVVNNNKALCEEVKKMGEAELFKELMSDVKRFYYNGENEYFNKISRDAVKDFSN